MKFHRTTLLILSFGIFVNALAQTSDSHVRTEYMPKEKMTRVKTDLMFVINEPEQFMQISLAAFYPGQQLTTPPKKINITIFSISPKLIYEYIKNQNLIVITDGESWKAGDLTYWSGKGEKSKAGQGIFVNEKQSGLGLDSHLPEDARVKVGREMNQLYMEWLMIDLKSEQFAKIEKARTVEFQVGKTKFQFTKNQMNTILAFASLLRS